MVAMAWAGNRRDCNLVIINLGYRNQEKMEKLIPRAIIDLRRQKFLKPTMQAESRMWQ